MLVAFGATFLATFYFSLCQKRLLGAIHQRELNKESREDGKALEQNLLTKMEHL